MWFSPLVIILLAMNMYEPCMVVRVRHIFGRFGFLTLMEDGWLVRWPAHNKIPCRLHTWFSTLQPVGWVGVLVIEMAPGVFLTNNPRRIFLDSILSFSSVTRQGFGPFHCIKSGMTLSTPSYVYTYHCANARTHGSAAFFFFSSIHTGSQLWGYM